MIHVTDLSTLRSKCQSEREALIGAAYLRHLPDDEALVKIRKHGTYTTEDTARFARRSSTIPGTDFHRVRIRSRGGRIWLTPAPQAVHDYIVSSDDVHVFRLADGADFSDFDDTDQTALTDFPVDFAAGPADPECDRPPRFPE